MWLLRNNIATTFLTPRRAHSFRIQCFNKSNTSGRLAGAYFAGASAAAVSTAALASTLTGCIGISSDHDIMSYIRTEEA